MGRAKWILALLVVIVITGLVYHVTGRNAWLLVHAVGTIVFLIWTVWHYSSFGLPARKGPGALQETEHIILNVKLCQACWKCVDSCPKHVLGKVNLPFHKHVLITNPNSCIGCKKCVSGCETGALTAKE